MYRRDFLAKAGGVLALGACAAACSAETPVADSLETTGVGVNDHPNGSDDEWDAVRTSFNLSPDVVHMSAMLVASHPKPVREAIERHRQGLDSDPVAYLEANNRPRDNAVRAAAGRYLDVSGSNIAITDSTTMGIGLVYNGLRLEPGQEILSTEEDYYVTHEALRVASKRSGASVRNIQLFERVQDVSQDEIVGRIADAITPQTRVLALTWVHSSTGLKLPLRAIGQAVSKANADRNEDSALLFCVDAVHGFGVENESFAEIGCDFLVSGCHKWLFGPRGTGIVAGTNRGWRSTIPSIPSFVDDGAWQAWQTDDDKVGPTTALRMTPGGFKAFEHRWAMTEAFEFQEKLGKQRVAERTHALASQLKEELAAMPGVTLHTPRSEALSAGIVSFDIDGMRPATAVQRLRERKIVASVAPYATPHVRLTPSIRNSTGEIETAAREIHALAG
jgi:isopenicillin-N epimerase